MTITAFRIFKTKRSANWFDGEGAMLYGGRWNLPGMRLLYASQSLSLAALEMLVHLNDAALLFSYSFARLEFSQRLVVGVGNVQPLPNNWSDSPPSMDVQQIGSEWVNSKASAILKVPSAVVKGESNFLINVEHKDFSKVKLGVPEHFVFDARLRK